MIKRYHLLEGFLLLIASSTIFASVVFLLIYNMNMNEYVNDTLETGTVSKFVFYAKDKQICFSRPKNSNYLVNHKLDNTNILLKTVPG